MSKWFEKFKKDKTNKKDFTKEDLPDNRFDQFFDVIKTRFTGLVTLNLLYAIFILPMLLLLDDAPNHRAVIWKQACLTSCFT